MNYTLALLVTFLLFNCYLAYRNYKVYEERGRIIDKTYNLNKKDISKREYDLLDYRSDILEKYTYSEMLFKFWIPVKDFYKDIDWKEKK